jgi:hypothetical protein
MPLPSTTTTFGGASRLSNIALLYQTRQNVYPTGFHTPGQGKDINEYYVGGSYDFRVVEAMGSDQAKNDKNIGNLDNATWSLGAVVSVLASSQIRFGHGQTECDQGHKAPALAPLAKATRPSWLGGHATSSKSIPAICQDRLTAIARCLAHVVVSGSRPTFDRATHAEAVAVAKST